MNNVLGDIKPNPETCWLQTDSVFSARETGKQPRPERFRNTDTRILNRNRDNIIGRGDVHTDVAVRRIANSVINQARSEEHTSELQSQFHLVCRLLLEK